MTLARNLTAAFLGAALLAGSAASADQLADIKAAGKIVTATDMHYAPFDMLVGEVLAVMKALASEGMTMVVVTHEMGFAAHVADRVAFMKKGELVAVDAPAGILHQPQDPRIQSFLRTYLERNSF